MSAATNLQTAVATKLQAAFTATVGDGSATSFPLAHHFGTRAIYLEVKEGETTLVNGTDYTVAFPDVNTATLTALGSAPATDAWTVHLALLRKAVPVVAFKTADLALKVEAIAAAAEIGILVWPPLPTRFEQGNPFVFFSRAELRVTIVEQPPLNETGVDVFDLMDDVMHALHWQTFDGISLAHPLQLAETPTEMIWNPATRLEGLATNTRMIDVIFEAVFGLQPTTAGTL